jgi:hypothetical protein
MFAGRLENLLAMMAKLMKDGRVENLVIEVTTNEDPIRVLVPSLVETFARTPLRIVKFDDAYEAVRPAVQRNAASAFGRITPGIRSLLD